MPTLDDPTPQPPPEPDARDCCGEGCVNCIFDMYDDALERYRAELAAWQERQRDRATCSTAQTSLAGRRHED